MQSNSVGQSYFKEHALKIVFVFTGVFVAAELAQAAATNAAFRPANVWLGLAFHLPAALIGLFAALLALPRERGSGGAEAALDDENKAIDEFSRPFESVTEGVVIYREGAVLYVNESARKLYGATSKGELLNRSVEELLNAGRSDRHAAAIDSCTPFLIRDTVFERFDGKELHASILIVPIQIGGRDARMAVLHNLQNNDRMSRELHTVESQLQTIMHNLDVGIWSFDLLEQRMLLVSDRFADMIGARKQDILSKPEIWKNVIFPDDSTEADKWFAELLEGQPVTAEVRLPRSDGPVRFGESKMFPFKDEDGRVVRLDGILVDITERALARQRSEFLAFHDELTMLPNRRMFKETLQRLKLNASEKNRRFAVIYLDMDKFKLVNDTYGHANGDLFLREVAQRLQQAGPEHQHLFRVGGDEFTVVLDGVQDRGQLEGWVSKLMHAFDEPFAVQGERIPVRGSMGIAIYPDDASDIGVLVNLADRAMFAAKETGAPYQYYNAAVLGETTHDPELVQELRQGIERRQFVLYFQPKYDIASRTLTGAEALIRWDHPAKGVLPPSVFIPLAEKTGLISDIGTWVVDQACRQIRKWSDNGMPVPVSVNVSANQFHEGQIVKAVQDAIQRNGVQPELLEIEITESVAADFEHAVAVLQQLHGIGVVISVDDFGIGYSSLNYLKKFPIQKLKIDRSFIQDIADQPSDAKIVGTILTLAHALQLKVVAEGVETERQLEVLERLGCDEAQGFLFSRPVPAEALERLVAEHVREYKQETHRGARLKGVFLKNVIGSLLTGKAMFPEYKKLLEEIVDNAYYSWDLYTKMLHDVADKLSPQVVRDVGMRVILSGRDVFMKEQGYDTLEKLLQDYPRMFDQTIVGAPEHERIKYLKYEPGHFIMLYTKRQPKAFNEGVIRGYFKMYDRHIRTLHIEDYDEHYYKIEVTW